MGTKRSRELESRILFKEAKVGIVGLGYVGLPLAMEFARAGFDVHGIDLATDKVESLNLGQSHVSDVSSQVVERAVESGRFKAHSDYEIVSDLDCVIVCVPTPLRQTKDPDISYIVEAAHQIGAKLHKGMLIVLQSTTYPGTTEEVLFPELQRSNLELGVDLFVAFSPERVDPGNAVYNTRNTPKIVGGFTPRCGAMAKLLYEQAIDQVIPVSSAATAEMVKLLENTFRAVNIGLVNEIAIMCDRLGVDVWEVISAAASKPFGFMPFFPGPGLGGHCIPIDPLYLSWKLKMLNYNARFIELASEINTHMPEYCVSKIVRVLNDQKKCVNGSRILFLGVSYKKDVNDMRESPALDILRLLRNRGAELSYSDPHVPELEVDDERMESIPLSQELIADFDLVVLVTDHSKFDYRLIQQSASMIFDTRNAFPEEAENIVKL